MKLKVLLFIAAAAGFGRVCAQNAAQPNELLAMQISLLVKKIGMPVDSAASYLIALNQFKKSGETAGDAFYASSDYNMTIDFKKNGAGTIQLIICDMPSDMLGTAKRVIDLLGMVASGSAAPPGFTAYATPDYAAFLNPQDRQDFLRLVLVPGK